MEATPTRHTASTRRTPKSIQDYVKSSEANRKGDETTWNAYLKRHVYDPKDHYAYLETVGIRKLLGLYTHPIVSW